MPDIINSLVDTGLTLVRFRDVPLTGSFGPFPALTPGSEPHVQSVLPFGIVIVSRRDT